jgi:DNA polymerase
MDGRVVDSLEKIETEIRLCQRCELRAGCSNPVPGFGSVGAKYFLIGESPGFNEDQSGVPFCGAAGRRLDTLLGLAKIDINDCYLSNAVRCRPPKNRDPRKKELKACTPFLWREIKLVKPTVLITLGSTPLSLFVPYGISQCHGSMMEVEVPDGN